MGKKDPRLDAYIANSADFAKPILRHLRQLVHQACPAVEETIKWSMPHFVHQGNLCHMAAFKQHCAFGFWKRALLFGNNTKPSDPEESAMGQFGRITSLADLPKDKVLLAHLREAVRLNEAGIERPPRPRSKAAQKLVVPPYFLAVLRKNQRALAAFEGFSYSHKKEYVEWIIEAKREETRQKRIATALAGLADGNSRTWKYQNC